MLLPYTGLTYYGPAASAMVTQAAASVVGGISGVGRAGSLINAGGSVPLAKATRLVNSPMVASGSGAMVLALPKGRARAGCVIRVNELSQDDVTGAVLESPVEDGVTLRQALRVLLAVAAGKTNVTDLGGGLAEVTFRDVNDTVTRVTADMVGSERDSVTLNTN